MANKIIELTLKVNGAQTLEEMSTATRELEQALRAAGKSAEGFNQGVTALAKSRAELKEFRQAARGIDFGDQIASVTRLTNGIISGFAVAKSAMSLFGAESDGAMDKAIKKMLEFQNVMIGLSNIAEVFEGKTFQSLKTIGSSFGKLVTTVKTASLAMKASLIATGIGAIAVAVGLIIANWEKIVKIAKVALGIEKDQVKEAEKRIEYQKELLKVTEEQVKAEDDLAKLTGDKILGYQSEIRLQQEKLRLLQDERIVLEDTLKKQEEKNGKLGFFRGLWVGTLNSVGLYSAAQKSIANGLEKQNQEMKKSQEEIAANQAKQNLLVAQQLQTTEQLNIANKELSEQYRKRIDGLKEANDLLATGYDNEVKILQNKKKIQQIDYEQRKFAVEQAKATLQEVEAKFKAGEVTQELVDAEKLRLYYLELDRDVSLGQVSVLQQQINIKKQELAVQAYLVKETQNLKEQELEINNAIKSGQLGLAQQSAELEFIMQRQKSIALYMEAQTKTVEITNKGYEDARQIIEETSKSILKMSGYAQQVTTQLSPSNIRITNDAYQELLKTFNDMATAAAYSGDELNLLTQEQLKAQEELVAEDYKRYKILTQQRNAIEENTKLDEFSKNIYLKQNEAERDLLAKKIEEKTINFEIQAGAENALNTFKEQLKIAEKQYLNQALLGDEQLRLVTYKDKQTKLETELAGLSFDISKISDDNLRNAIQELALNDAMSNVKKSELQTRQAIINKETASLELNYQALVSTQSALMNKQDLLNNQLETEREIVAETLRLNPALKGTTKEVELQNNLKLKEQQITGELIDLEREISENAKELFISNEAVVQSKIKSKEVDTQIVKVTGDQENNHKKIVARLKEQERLSQRIGKFWQENGETITAVADILSAGMELAMQGLKNSMISMEANFQQFTINQQAYVDQLQQDLDALQESAGEGKSRLEELLEMREDADASRLQAIDDEISKINDKSAVEAQAIKDKQNAIIRANNATKIAETKYKNDMAQAEHKAAQQQKAVNIINAVMNTALAVMKAAPNPVMMILMGVLGAASVALIASQKVPAAMVYPAPVLEKEIKAKGGLIDGPSHKSGGVDINAEGGEWIAPKWMVTNPRTAPVIAGLEQIRTKKYAEGGQVSMAQPALAQATTTPMIDYDLLAEKLAGMNIWVSVAEIKDADRKFTNVIYKGSSI
jgi:hypothetical protein